MITQAEMIRIFSQLSVYYPEWSRDRSKDDITASINAYQIALADIDWEILQKAVVIHVETSKFFPHVSELRQIATDLTTPAYDPPLAAWAGCIIGQPPNQIAHDVFQLLNLDRFDLENMPRDTLAREQRSFIAEYDRRVQNAKAKAVLPVRMKQNQPAIDFHPKKSNYLSLPSPPEEGPGDDTNDCKSWTDVANLVANIVKKQEEKQVEERTRRVQVQKQKLREQAEWLLKEEGKS